MSGTTPAELAVEVGGQLVEAVALRHEAAQPGDQPAR
jgi:hypothetical protein